MSDIKLFKVSTGKAVQLQGDASDLEKPLQTLIESNLEELLGIRFLATEYSTGKTHGGRIDTLGLDENDCPVIIEYKRSIGENVINQGLFYLDWLMDHQAEFKLLVMDKLGRDAADDIDWSEPRLVCIAADFTKFDAHAVQQISRSIELIRYRMFGRELLLLESANTASSSVKPSRVATTKPLSQSASKNTDKSFTEWAGDLSPSMTELLTSLTDYILSLGDDVQCKELKLYMAFKRIKNFATVVLQSNRLLVFLHLDPTEISPMPANGRDVSDIGHWGTGDVELSLSTMDDLDAAKPYLLMAYVGRAG